MEKTNPDRLLWAPPKKIVTNPVATWQPSPWKYNNIRVWTKHVPGICNLHRVGWNGELYFYSWNADYIPNFF
jgi:hypothetical protein